MARDRKRAKQRQRRRAPQRQRAQAAARPEASEAFAQRSDDAAPEPLEHSSGEVDLAEAAIVDPPEAELSVEELPQDDELEPDDDRAADELQEEVAPPARGRDGDGGPPTARVRRAPGSELPKEGNRVVNFLRACAAELRRVQWPDRKQVSQATGVVLGFVIIAGAYLGLLDAVFSRLVALIL
jgi:preprotein translocase subunit SecE